MIDNIRIKASIRDGLKIDVYGNPWIGKLKLVPYFCPKTHKITKHHCEFRGLLFTLTESELKISNSIHKFKNRNNYTDFSFSMLVQAIIEIEELTGISASEFQIVKLEFGLNIITGVPACEYLAYFSDYKCIQYNKMLSFNKWYGVKYGLTDYALKIYDKSVQASKELRYNIQPCITRVEMEVKRVNRYFHVHSLEELKKAETLHLLYNSFINKIKRINCQGSEDFKNCTPRERQLYFAGKDEIFWKLEKQLNINTAKSKRKDFQNLQQKIVGERPIEIILLMLEEKFKFLMNK
jgi:hypothetical protein